MTNEQKIEIEKISKEFTSGFKPEIEEIKSSGWLIVDPLSAYLNACGFENTLKEMPANDKHPQILVMTFDDGTQFIPAGSDLPFKNAPDWMWL